jgi:hypothetical protein
MMNKDGHLIQTIMAVNETDRAMAIHYEEATGKLITSKTTWHHIYGYTIWIQRRWQSNGQTQLETVAIIPND